MVFVSSGGASTADSMSTPELLLIADQRAWTDELFILVRGSLLAHTCACGQGWCVPISNDAKKESLRRAQKDFPAPFVKGASFPPLANNPTRRKRSDVRRMC
jgi:hypothetical protein